MSIDRYAELERATGDTVMNINGVWWQRVRPFFYRPLLPFKIIDVPTRKRHFNPFTFFQCAVESGQPHNSYINLLVFDDVQSYTLQSLGKSCRKKVRNFGRKNVNISQLSDPEEFIEKGFPVYLSFYNRTHFNYRKDRRKKERFAEWARALFSFPELMILGAVHQGKLLTIEITCLVDDVLIWKDSINSDEALMFHTSELFLHYHREQAAKVPGIKMINAGGLSQNSGINNFKIERGAHILTLPAYLTVPTALLGAFRLFRNEVYERLRGMDEAQVGATLDQQYRHRTRKMEDLKVSPLSEVEVNERETH